MTTELEFRGSANLSDVSREVRLLAEALAHRHGTCTLAREEHGLHLYCASPIALERDGAVELLKRHLAINLDKHLGTGQHINISGRKRQAVGRCMKYGQTYRVDQLLRMPPLSQRLPPGATATPSVVRRVRKDQWLEPDQQDPSRLVPMRPTCVPITSLDAEHPAAQYLSSRHYDFQVLEQQFNTSFCTTEIPEDKVLGRVYRSLPHGWKVTSQGRIIFFAHQQGQYCGWQGRVLQADHEGIRYYWHPYRQGWEACEQFVPELAKWRPLPHLGPDFEMLRYWTGPGTARSEVLLGFDAAVAARFRFGPVPTCILCEGPLDAARFGPPAMPLLGKFLGSGQAELIRRHFRRVLYVRDNDPSGEQAAASVSKSLAGACQVDQAVLSGYARPDGMPAKDPGDLSPEQGVEFLSKQFGQYGK